MFPPRFIAHHFRVLVFCLACAPALFAAETHDFRKKPAAWFVTDEAKTIAANIFSYQSDYGGWPKNMDLTAAPFSGQPVDLVGEFKPIFDNGATTDEVRFMARMFRATKGARYLRAVEMASTTSSSRNIRPAAGRRPIRPIRLITGTSRSTTMRWCGSCGCSGRSRTRTHLAFSMPTGGARWHRLFNAASSAS